jgi:tellurite resistance protein
LKAVFFCILAKNNNLMKSFEEKRNLLLEMIAFSTIDGQLHRREYNFLLLIAQELNINKDVFNDLFHQELPQTPLKSEFERIQQFYRLALLMHSDGTLHAKEEEAIQQISLNMGLNPVATNRILKIMKSGSSPIISPDRILSIFQEQHN